MALSAAAAALSRTLLQHASLPAAASAALAAPALSAWQLLAGGSNSNNRSAILKEHKGEGCLGIWV